MPLNVQTLFSCITEQFVTPLFIMHAHTDASETMVELVHKHNAYRYYYAPLYDGNRKNIFWAFKKIQIYNNSYTYQRVR